MGAGTLLANTANENTATGAGALLSNTTGEENTAHGAFALFSNTTGNSNTALGYAALRNNSNSENVAVGLQALFSNTAFGNTAVGSRALFSNTTGSFNTANGFNALSSTTTGDNNTANGVNALFNNTIGFRNTANGVNALASNTTGNNNTVNGVNALVSNTTGGDNTASGFEALKSNTEGFSNTANGYRALLNNIGSGNTALGYLAGSNLTNGDDNICIGNVGVAGDGGTIRIGEPFIGTTYIAGIFGQTSSGGTGVFINSDGKLGTTTSSRRFKDDIKPMDQASEALFALKPVSFRYKKEIDPQGIPQFGLVAEDVEAVNPDLVLRNKEGQVNTVRYEQINAMLLNEFLKEHRKVEEQQVQIIELRSRLAKEEGTTAQQRKDFEAIAAQQQSEIQALTAGLKEQTVQIRSVSVQIEMSRSAQKVVLTKP